MQLVSDNIPLQLEKIHRVMVRLTQSTAIGQENPSGAGHCRFISFKGDFGNCLIIED